MARRLSRAPRARVMAAELEGVLDFRLGKGVIGGSLFVCVFVRGLGVEALLAARYCQFSCPAAEGVTGFTQAQASRIRRRLHIFGVGRSRSRPRFGAREMGGWLVRAERPAPGAVRC